MDFWYTLAIWFLLFIIYSFCGWLMEVIVTILQRRKLVNRGFLVGPICPIYGVGAVLLSLILGQAENWFAIFCVGVVGSAILEYFVSFLMEKLFRVRWWDYADRAFNLNGRICLESAISFGLIAIIIIKCATPFFLWLFSTMPIWLVCTLAILLLAWLIADIALSLWLILGVRITVGTAERDATEEISERIHEILMNKGKLNRRLVKAFPEQKPSQKTKKSTPKSSNHTRSQPTKE